MIWVDYRVGSIEFLPLLVKAGVPAQKATLDAADFAFEGNGPEGRVEVGVERKALADLVSSLQTGRLQGLQTESGAGGQLGRLVETYDFPWLLVEGNWSSDRQGRLTTRSGRSGRTQAVPGGLTEDMLAKRLLTLELVGGLHLHQTASMRQSAAWLASLYRWFTDKEWAAHGSLNVVAKAKQPLSARRVTRFQEMLMTLPGVGLAVAVAIERECPGLNKLQELWNLPTWKLAEVRVGPKALGWSKAEAIVEALKSL